MTEQHPQTQHPIHTQAAPSIPPRTQPQLMFWAPQSPQLEAMRRQATIFSSAPLE